jgi:2-oxo-3-hexenedioate decarboxylase
VNASTRLEQSPALERLATRLDDARLTSTPIEDRAEFDALSLDDAYALQHAGIARARSRGDGGVGVKLGFTSADKMRQMGVHTPIVGTLLASFEHRDGSDVDASGLIHPRIEPELAFRLSCDVPRGAGVAEVVGAVGAVAPALEIIDSRFAGFSFTLSSVVADNTSAAGFAIGAWRRFDRRDDLGNLAVRLLVGDRVVAIGSTAALLGHPLRVLGLLAVAASAHGFELHEGDVILAGAATAAVGLMPGPAAAEIAGLGRVQLNIEGGPHA